MVRIILILLTFFLSFVSQAKQLPKNFVYLSGIDGTIRQDLRYAGEHNFIGRPIDGYQRGQCILTHKTALALKHAQSLLRKRHLTLMVYDCYRPTRAVADMLRWSHDPKEKKMKKEFYPNVDKKNLFRLGYIANQSGHSRGSTVDLTIIPIGIGLKEFDNNQPLKSCIATYKRRYVDQSIDMGTGFDCFDQRAHIDNREINSVAQQNRALLQRIMRQVGFKPYRYEWWHFTLKNEPYPNHYFNFVVK